MSNYWDLIIKAYSDYANWLGEEIIKPHWGNFFYWVIGLSILFFLLEIIKPWRKEQALFRKDFWLDLFYVFFNFFIFSLVIWNAAQAILVNAFSDFLGLFGLENVIMLEMDKLPVWAFYLILFVAGDFISWWVHRLLHRVSWMWQWHKVHHSVEEMGFAAHVRYHWMENVIYWSIRFIPLTMLGADLVDIFWVHVFNMAWGHFNHANITVNPRISGGVLGALVALGLSALYVDDLWMGVGIVSASAAFGALVIGPYMRYIFNSPEMHIWHHAWEIPEDKPYGMNFGITLAIWDYIFGTAHVPESGRDISLGFQGLANFPQSFLGQLIYGFPGKDEDDELEQS